MLPYSIFLTRDGDGGAGTDAGGAHKLGDLRVRVGGWVAAVLGG